MQVSGPELGLQMRTRTGMTHAARPEAEPSAAAGPAGVEPEAVGYAAAVVWVAAAAAAMLLLLLQEQ